MIEHSAGSSGKGVKSSSSSRAQVKLQDCQAREFYLRSGVYSGYECMDGSSMSSTGMPFALTRTKASFFIVLSKKIYRRSQSEMELANKEVSLQATLTVRTRILVVMITLTWLQWSCDCVVIANAMRLTKVWRRTEHWSIGRHWYMNSVLELQEADRDGLSHY